MEYRVEVDHELYGWVVVEEGISELDIDSKVAAYRADPGCPSDERVRSRQSDEFGVYW